MRFERTTTIVIFAALALTLPATLAGPREAASAAQDWPQWRGPARDGTVAGADWPADLAGLELLWRVELGKGYPGPIVAGDRVFVVESLANEDVTVRALGAEDGKELWRQSWPSSGKVPFFAAKNGDWVRSTPAWDGTTLYVGDMQEVLVALDGGTGEVRWTADLAGRYETPAPDFGFASSPLHDDGFLYVQAANSILKLDAGSGDTVWRALGGDGKITSSGAFSSPVIATLAGERQLVVQTRQSLAGLSLDDGGELWSVDVPNFRGMNILTPTVHGDTVFTSSYKNGSYLFAVRRDEGSFTVDRVWENKASAYMSSPVVVDGHAYVHLGNRRIDCIDLKTGESRWRSEPFGEYWSMIAQGDRILALDADGTLHLVDADAAAFATADSRSIADEETWGHLAIRGRSIYVRELNAVAAWRWTDAPRVAQP